ncbi:hypothetical protein [Candidatus Protochlamydia phocaeensis]|uniref:hypothetical protein n=1 Tax=Candidatus Protochlamydia phocaeensis TaxID=1414722 RepID=UPI000838F252|nr:hypothetical protein [Candidatus Protochlamydia phocaeensis]
MSSNTTISPLISIPGTALLGAAGGYIYGKLFNADSILAAKVFAVNNAASTIFHLLAFKLFGGSPIRNLSVKAITGVITGTISIFALRHFNLIATTGTVFLGTLNALTVIYYLGQREQLRRCQAAGLNA